MTRKRNPLNPLIYGPIPTIGRLCQRQDRGSRPPIYPPCCRGWVQGRWQSFCPLPKGARPPRESRSRPLISRFAASMLNRDSFHTDTCRKP